MATNFPTSLDSLTNPTAGNTLASPSHAGQHADANDAIEALQAKVGVNGSAVTTSLDYKVAQAATLTGTQTLTNKTLTAPVISSISNTGTLTLPTSTDTLVGRATTDTLTNKTLALGSNTVSGTLAQFNTAVTDGDLVSLAGSETLTNKTLTSPTINGAVLDRTEENWNIVASAATGTINLDVNTASIWYYTSNASANHTINVRGDSGTTLSSLVAVGDSITVVWANTNGATAYYPSAFQVDGSSVTPKWQGGTAPTAGNASSIDVYSYTIVKTAATPTYTVFASQTKFA